MKKGIIITPEDTIGIDWPAKMRDLRLNTLGIHSGGGANHDVIAKLGSLENNVVRRQCAEAGIHCEYENHAMENLLNPSLFAPTPNLFAMPFQESTRTSAANGCVSNPKTLDIIAKNAEELARKIPSDTHCYYFWGADQSSGFCHCPKCSQYTFSELNLMMSNAIAKGIRRADPLGKAACLIYVNCYEIPQKISPAENVFFEFAPYVRCYHHSIADGSCQINRAFAESFQNYVTHFGADRMQVLEYWLDSSLFSHYKKPARKPFVTADVIRQDLDFYCSAGIKDITTFAVYMDQTYFKTYGDEQIQLYAKILNEFIPTPT